MILTDMDVSICYYLAREDRSWHYTFDIPWNKMPSNTRRVLDTEKRPTAAERREIIRIVAAEILTAWKKPGKRNSKENGNYLPKILPR